METCKLAGLLTMNKSHHANGTTSGYDLPRRAQIRPDKTTTRTLRRKNVPNLLCSPDVWSHFQRQSWQEIHCDMITIGELKSASSRTYRTSMPVVHNSISMYMCVRVYNVSLSLSLFVHTCTYLLGYVCTYSIFTLCTQ